MMHCQEPWKKNKKSEKKFPADKGWLRCSKSLQMHKFSPPFWHIIKATTGENYWKQPISAKIQEFQQNQRSIGYQLPEESESDCLVRIFKGFKRGEYQLSLMSAEVKHSTAVLHKARGACGPT